MFTHLHVHSEYSPLDGMGKIEELVLRAKELGQKAIAITDHGSMAGHFELEKICNKHGIKPIIGNEFYMSMGDEACKEDCNYHIIVLAKNKKGLENMYKLQAKAYKENFYRKAHVNFNMLKEHSEGLIICSACIGGVIGQLTLSDLSKAKSEAKKYKEAFGEDYYLEIQPNDIPDQWIMNKAVISMSKELGIKLIATNDVHYV